MTAQQRITRLSEHLEPVDVPTHYPPPKIKRIGIRLSRAIGVRVTAWLFCRTSASISQWRNQARDGECDATLDRRSRGGTPRGPMCNTR